MKIPTSKLTLVTALVASLLALFTSQLALSSEASREAPSRDRGADSPAQSIIDEGMINENQVLQISNARLKINPSGKNAAAYMTIKNNSTNEVVIKSISVSQDFASKAEMHETITKIIDKQQVKEMRAVETFSIPALGTLQLKPGDSHIMLLDLTQNLSKDGKEVESVTITLNFKDNESQDVAAQDVRLRVETFGSTKSLQKKIQK